MLCAFGWALDFCGPSAWWFSLGFAASGSAGGGEVLECFCCGCS